MGYGVPMRRFTLSVLVGWLAACGTCPAGAVPLGTPGLAARYSFDGDGQLPGSVVKAFTIALGQAEEDGSAARQWLHLSAEKANGESFRVWALGSVYPARTETAARETVSRYLLQAGSGQPLEYRNRFTGAAVLPRLGAWEHLFPRQTTDAAKGLFPSQVRYLGHRYRRLVDAAVGDVASPPEARVIELLPDLLLGVPHATKQKDQTRLFDESDYELIPLTQADYELMLESGMTCLFVRPEIADWAKTRDVFYWGPGGGDVSYPECLYRSNYLGPSLFLDEPAVVTRDHRIRPRLRKDPAYRKAITPQLALDELREHFHKKKTEGTPTALLRGLDNRPDVDTGGMHFLQRNIYSWETMVSTAGYQLSEGGAAPPSSMVWEPPGRVGTRRTLPEMNMTYGCQIPVDSPKNFASIIYGFLRGAARATNRDWGMSIYGAVDRTDAFWFQTHAHDLGARLFFFWDSHKLACVPFNECLALARNLRAHAESHPHRDVARLKRAAEVLILLPPGYNLGHVYMGKGSLWGVGELNLERRNREGVKYRVVMGNFFTEIERCLRQGVAFDLLWDLDGFEHTGYREVVRVREDGRVEVRTGEKNVVLEKARTPARPGGTPPRLAVSVSPATAPAPLTMTARATITEGDAAIYYTLGANKKGVYRNVMAAWELYGPEDEDYRFLRWESEEARISRGDDATAVEIEFKVQAPGRYRLRTATVDMAGRTAAVWKEFNVKPGPAR